MSEVDKTPVASAVIPVAVPAAVPMSEQEKLGAKCCGCCCDYRRAVVALGVVGMVVSIIYLILTIAVTSFAAVVTDSFDDDVVVKSLEDATGVGAIYSITFAISVLGYIWQVCAALRYSICMLCCTILVALYTFAIQVYYTVQAQSLVDNGNTSLIVQIVCQVIFCGLYIYPVVGLIVEIKNGIMSKETYPREAYSCCCQPRPQ